MALTEVFVLLAQAFAAVGAHLTQFSLHKAHVCIDLVARHENDLKALVVVIYFLTIDLVIIFRVPIRAVEASLRIVSNLL